MRPAAICLVALAGLPAAALAQPTVTYTLDWIEVVANSSTPVAIPNGLVEPGEGARVRVTTLITPGVGSTATYTPPPAPGSGTIAGIGSIFFDLHQQGALGGTWSHPRNVLRPSGGWPPEPTLFPNPDGSLSAAQAGQFVLPGSVANSTNPLPSLWSATWTPATYAPRQATFTSAPAVAAGSNHSSILIQYGTEPGTGAPMYVGAFVGGIFGNTGPIPIVPAPATLLSLATALFLSRRRRP